MADLSNKQIIDSLYKPVLKALTNVYDNDLLTTEPFIKWFLEEGLKTGVSKFYHKHIVNYLEALVDVSPEDCDTYKIKCNIIETLSKSGKATEENTVTLGGISSYLEKMNYFLYQGKKYLESGTIIDIASKSDEEEPDSSPSTKKMKRARPAQAKNTLTGFTYVTDKDPKDGATAHGSKNSKLTLNAVCNRGNTPQVKNTSETSLRIYTLNQDTYTVQSLKVSKTI